MQAGLELWSVGGQPCCGAAVAGQSLLFMELTMPTPRELEDKFWSALKSDRTMMLGLDGVEDGHAPP
jgi:hypothetical protein